MRAVLTVRARSIHVRWITACALAELIGIGVAGAAAVTMQAAIGEPTTPGMRWAALALFAAVGAIEGSALGILQWRVLRDRLPRLRVGEWAGVTIAVAVVGWLGGMAGPLFAGGSAEGDAAASEPSLLAITLLAAGTGAAAGAVFGAAQWLVLRRHAVHGGRWIAIHVPGWAAAMAAIFVGAALPAPGWPLWQIVLSGAAGGTLGGALLGAITGVVVRRLEPWVDERTGGRDPDAGARRERARRRVRSRVAGLGPRGGRGAARALAAARRARAFRGRDVRTSRAQAHLPAVMRLLIATILRPGFVRGELGALPVLRLAARPVLDASGAFFDRFRQVAGGPDPQLAAALWRACEDLVSSRSSEKSSALRSGR
jgi:hypothetical protein